MDNNDNLKLETLESVKEYIGKLIPGIDSCTSKLQQGDRQSGLDMLGAIIEGLDWLINALRLTSSVQKQNLDLTIMDNQISDMIDALENGDIILVSDLLLYEVKPVIESWNSILHGEDNSKRLS